MLTNDHQFLKVTYTRVKRFQEFLKVTYTRVKWFQEFLKVTYTRVKWFLEFLKVTYTRVKWFLESRNSFTPLLDGFRNKRQQLTVMNMISVYLNTYY